MSKRDNAGRMNRASLVVTERQIWLNLCELGVLIARLGLAYG